MTTFKGKWVRTENDNEGVAREGVVFSECSQALYAKEGGYLGMPENVVKSEDLIGRVTSKVIRITKYDGEILETPWFAQRDKQGDFRVLGRNNSIGWIFEYDQHLIEEWSVAE